MGKEPEVHSNSKRTVQAITVIVIFGVISMLGDTVYEAARGANSQYFSLLGISAAQVGIVFGIGEFLGYSLRLIAGVMSDRSGRYWLFMFAGYGTLLVVPLMGLTTGWSILVILVLMERIGKALRNPAKDTILSGVAENRTGVGFAFGLQEALDQVGAFAGPLVFTIFFYMAGKSGIPQYQAGYKALLVPFGLLMAFLVFAYRKITRNELVAETPKKEFKHENARPLFWLYTAFTFFCTLGFVNFSVIGYHLKARNLLADGDITLLYSAAMIVDALAALAVGRIYDSLKKKSGIKTRGLIVLAAIPPVTLMLPVLTLGASAAAAAAGMAAFGIVMGTHETVMRSAIADIVPYNKRGTGYGIFNTSYGLALLGGSSVMGLLYDLGRTDVIIIFTCIVEAAALFLYFKMIRKAGDAKED